MIRIVVAKYVFCEAAVWSSIVKSRKQFFLFNLIILAIIKILYVHSSSLKTDTKYVSHN